MHCPFALGSNGKLEDLSAELKSLASQKSNQTELNWTEPNKWNRLTENFERDNPELVQCAYHKI